MSSPAQPVEGPVAYLVNVFDRPCGHASLRLCGPLARNFSLARCRGVPLAQFSLWLHRLDTLNKGR